MFVQFGECFCKGIQLNDRDVIIVEGSNEHTTFIMSKMSEHNGTVTEIGFPETAEMVAKIHNLINDGRKMGELRRLLK